MMELENVADDAVVDGERSVGFAVVLMVVVVMNLGTTLSHRNLHFCSLMAIFSTARYLDEDTSVRVIHN